MGWAQLLRQLRGLRRHVRGGGGLALHAAGVEALQLGVGGRGRHLGKTLGKPEENHRKMEVYSWFTIFYYGLIWFNLVEWWDDLR